MKSKRQEGHWLEPLIWRAYREARRGKRGTLDEQRFERHAAIYLAELIDDIEARTYRPSRSVAFIISRPVIREIFAAPFRDRIVHHLLFDVVNPYWEEQFINDSYSCRVGKGVLYAVRRLYENMRQVSQDWTQPAYVLKLDLQGYFMSLPRQRLFEVAKQGLIEQFGSHKRIYRTIKFLWQRIIFDDPIAGVKQRGSLSDWKKLPKPKSLFTAKKGCGLVIGNLTSQLLSNIYLDRLDKYVTLRLGFQHYGRYVDDFYIVHHDKAELVRVMNEIDRFVATLGLKLHPNKRMLQAIERGVPFLGAVVYPGRIHPGKRIKGNVYRLAKTYHARGGVDLACDDPLAVSMLSYHGLVMHYHHGKLWRRVLSLEHRAGTKN